MSDIIWTIGHSTRPVEEFIAILEHYAIKALVDVRTVPRSRHNPQFSKDALGAALEAEGIDYVHASNLGGLRHPLHDSVNTGWRNDSFRGYADYMQTEEFSEALSWLIEMARAKPTAIMCAETLPWRCHRSLIADALTIRGFEVIEILGLEKSQVHKLTPFAVVEGERITYPPPQPSLDIER